MTRKKALSINDLLINHLRNNLVHFRPLNIYLTYGEGKKKRLQNKNRKIIINAVLSASYNQNIKKIIDDIFINSDNFITMKNKKQSTKVD